MESRETVRAAKVLLVAGGLLLIGIVVGFILAGGGLLSAAGVWALLARRPA